MKWECWAALTLIHIYRSKNLFYTYLLSIEYIVDATSVTGNSVVCRIDIHGFWSHGACIIEGRTNNI